MAYIYGLDGWIDRVGYTLLLHHLLSYLSLLAFSGCLKKGSEFKGIEEIFILGKVNLPVMSRTLNYGI